MVATSKSAAGMRSKVGMAMAVLLCIFLVQEYAFATAEPHPHQGKAKPYKPGMPDIKLNKKQLSELDAGDLVQDMLKGETDEDGGKGGRALAVQDVNAPPEYVWDRILDFGKYNKMVPKVSDCKNYETQTLRNGTEVIKTELRLNVFGVKLDSYIYHTYFPSMSSLTWTLDYNRKSSLDDSVGFWHVAKHPSKEKEANWSRVYYSVQLRIPSWVPGLVIGYLNKKAIREATTWVKRESEQQYQGDVAAGRTLAGAKKGPLALPAWGGLGKGASSGDKSDWMPKWMKKEPEPEPEPEVVAPEPEPTRRRKVLRVARRTVLGVGGLAAGLAIDSTITGKGCGIGFGGWGPAGGSSDCGGSK